MLQLVLHLFLWSALLYTIYYCTIKQRTQRQKNYYKYNLEFPILN